VSKSVVGVVGAGVIGTGVAQSLAQAGHPVVLVDSSPEALERAVDAVTRGVTMAALLTGRRSSADDVLANITRTTDYEALGSAAFVVENVTEDETIKFEIYPRLDEVCARETVLAANTSAVPIAKLAALTKRADRVLIS
jgi:3-hydroxybutyryl-CoA dehydrogenase